jgi:hypothetical protein
MQNPVNLRRESPWQCVETLFSFAVSTEITEKQRGEKTVSKKNKGTKNAQVVGDNAGTQNTQGGRMEDNAGKKGGAQSNSGKGYR